METVNNLVVIGGGALRVKFGDWCVDVVVVRDILVGGGGCFVECVVMCFAYGKCE